MVKTQEKLIKEEQQVLDELIEDMDNALLDLDRKLTYNELQVKKAKESCLSDAYGMLISAEQEKKIAHYEKNEFQRSRDELYETHMIVEVSDEDGEECKDIKVGLHTYSRMGHIFIMSWLRPLCRHYLLDNSTEVYDGVVIGKHGEKYEAHYKLKLKRQVDLFFDKVKSVKHFFPIADEEAEKIIADEFLQELLNRRSNQEFKNIVFSIQKKQGEIIQTPFEQNLIVQGCAGSGKSMIMLHRLPIILYDNPNGLNRNNLYIITPSIAYIQMADNMRKDLEIEDLKMGTLEEYYNYVLEKYHCEAEVYGIIKPYIKLSEANLMYVYSSECIKDIQNEIKKIINKNNIDYEMGHSLLELKQVYSDATLPVEQIRQNLLKIQNMLSGNNDSLKSYYHNTVYVLKELKEFMQMLETREIAVNRSLARKIDNEGRIIIQNKKEIDKIEKPDEHKIRYDNHKNVILAAMNRITDLRETQEIVDLDGPYFEKLKNKARQIKEKLALFTMVKSEQIEMDIDEQYQMIEKKEFLCKICEEILEDAMNLEDPYWEYVDSIASSSKKLQIALRNLRENNRRYLPLDYLRKLLDANVDLKDAEQNTVHNVYLFIMKKLGQEPERKGSLDALECSPYLYLQILYLFKGAPNEVKESLITIDEAQNIEPEELRLIKALNGNKVVLNLFGDIKQHVEGRKGIDDWNVISDIADFKEEFMQENYRNARQITEFCNKQFKLSMRAINLDGRGVHEIHSKEEFEERFLEIFQKPQNVGLSCIIVKNKEEASTLINKVKSYKLKINNMTEEIVELQRNKWNLMTVEQAKGLEFETVFALTGRMSENEKYISYTRALDELYLYNEKIEIVKVELEKTMDRKDNEQLKERRIRKKRIKRKSKDNSLE